MKVWLGPPSKHTDENTAFQQSMDLRCVDWNQGVAPNRLPLWRIFRLPPNSVHASLPFAPARQAKAYLVAHLNRVFFGKVCRFPQRLPAFFPQQKTPKKTGLGRLDSVTSSSVVPWIGQCWKISDPPLYSIYTPEIKHRLILIIKTAIIGRRYIFQIIIHSIHWLILGCILVGIHGRGSKVREPKDRHKSYHHEATTTNTTLLVKSTPKQTWF